MQMAGAVLLNDEHTCPAAPPRSTYRLGRFGELSLGTIVFQGHCETYAISRCLSPGSPRVRRPRVLSFSGTPLWRSPPLKAKPSGSLPSHRTGDPYRPPFGG